MSTPEPTSRFDWLFAQKPRGRTFGIDRMGALAESLGHPERTIPCIHVAGTNGKGSVAAMLEAIFRTAGWRVGLYTSPHLVHLGERVQVDRVPLTDAEIVAFVEELRPRADRLAERDADLAPTFFEYMTAMAFLHFARHRCDVAIYEVGLGGRLDATNVLQPSASVITSIGLDHCEFLGDTLAQIAAEKAGIIKPGVPVIVGRVPAEAAGVIRDMATQRAATAIWVEEHFGEGREPLPSTNLEGAYQRWNAATAVLAARAAAKTLLPPRESGAAITSAARKPAPTDEQIAAALQHVNWPGRWERRQFGKRALILDASHNPEGAETLDANLAALIADTGYKPAVVVGVLGAKRARPLLAAVAKHAAEIRLVMPVDPRACTYAELEALIPADFPGGVFRDSVERLFGPEAGAASLAPAGPVVVTGSIYLIGEVMRRLEQRRQ